MIREKSHESILDYLKSLDKEPTSPDLSNKIEHTKAAFVKKPLMPVYPTEGVPDSACVSEASTIEIGNRSLILTTPFGESSRELKMGYLSPQSNSEIRLNHNELSIFTAPDLKMPPTHLVTNSPGESRRISDSLFNPVVKSESNSPQPQSNNSNQCGQEPPGTESKPSVDIILASKRNEPSQPCSNPKKGCCGCFSRLMQCCGLFRRSNPKTIPSKETIRLAENPMN